MGTTRTDLESTTSNGSGVPAGRGLTTPERLGVSLVIPARNEAANIGWVLERIPESVDEIVLVDGRSHDATISAALAVRPDVRVVEQVGDGKGDALTLGFRAATGQIIIMMDADGSMSPAEIPHFLYFLSQGFDLVKGSRFMLGGGSLDITRTRRAGNRALMSLVNGLYGVPLTDLCYGFVAFHRRALQHLDLTSTGFEVETRLTVSALRAGLKIAEVPSVELPRRAGISNLRTWRDGSRVLGSILRDYEVSVNGSGTRLGRRRPWRAGATSLDRRPSVPVL